ncbi:MAG: MFS transporter [Porticoccaceae bacterium]
MQHSPYPGFYGWRMLIALWLIYFSVVGFTFYGTPVMFPYMVADLGWSRGQVSLGFMTAMLMMGFAAPASAWSLNRFGGRHTMLVGGLLGATGLLLMLFTDSVLLYVLFFGLVVGTGIALAANIPVQTVITYWFNQRRGTAFGLVLAGGAIGGFVAPLALTATIDAADGQWRIGWVLLATMMAIAGLTSLLFVRNKPADLGQHPDGIDPAAATAAGDSATPTRIYRCATSWPLAAAIRTPQLWLVTAAIIGGQFHWQVFITQGPLHLADRGFTTEQYSLIYGITVGTSIIGRLGAGFIVDRVEPRLIFITALILGAVGSVLFWFISPQKPLTLLFPLFSGISFGAITIAYPNIIANYWGTTAFASVNGFIFPMMIICNSSAAPLSGAIHDGTGNYFIAFCIAWVMLAIAFFATLALSPPQRKESSAAAMVEQ